MTVGRITLNPCSVLPPNQMDDTFGQGLEEELGKMGMDTYKGNG